jgi:16S rRNA processing protein RimM
MAIPNDLVEMGYIAAPFGIQGWVKIKVTTESVDSLDGYKVIYLKDQQGIISEQKIEKSFAKDNILNAKLANTSDRDAAFALRGSVVCVSRVDFPKPAEDEFYWIDLIGLNVINSQNESFGVVKNLMETGASDVLVVSDGEVERLIPFVAQFILDVSLEKQQITVDWGLDY